MADETIVNKLGFSVEDALQQLQRLDTALQSSGAAFQTFGEKINAWNSQAESALNRMKEMASAASRLASAMSRAGSAPATPAGATGAPASQLWLPPDLAADMQKANQSMTALGNTATQAGEKMKVAGQHGHKAATDTGNAVKQAHDHMKAWTISWETLTRVMLTQAIVRALSQIRDLLKESVEEALKFSTRISELQTIAPKIDRNFQGLSKEVASLSKSFNFPLPDVAEAVYQTISNQFTTAGERADIMTASAKLAKVGVMDLNQAVLLLTGTLNAYGMKSDQAEVVAAKFFKTIELGRVRGAELTPIIGRIVPVAGELGVSLEEVNAAMVALTIGAQRVPEAATGLRSAMTALIKPSQDMQKELRNLGYDTPELAIKAEGLFGIFEKLKDSTDGNIAAMAKLVRNIRGLNAEARLTGDGAEKAAEALRAMTAPDLTESFNEVFKEFTSTDAQKYMAEWNKFKVTLASEIGPELVKFVSNLMNAAGGADGLASAIKGLANTVSELAVPLGTVFSLLAGWSLKGKLAGLTGFKGIMFNNVIAPLGMASFAVDFLDARMAAMLGNANENFDKQVKEIIAAQQKAAQERIDAEKKVADETLKQMARQVAELQRAYNKEVDLVREKDKEIVNSARVTMQAMITAREKVVQQFRSAAQDANKAAEDSMKRQAETQIKLDDFLFKRRLEDRQKYDDYFKKSDVLEKMYASRAMELASEAAKALAGSETPDQQRAAETIFQRAAAYAQEADQIARGTQDEWLRKDAADTVEAIMRKQIAAERELQTSSRARASAAAQVAATEQERVDRMKVAMKAILTDLDLFDKKGPMDPKKTAALSADLHEKMDLFKKDWMEGKDIDLGEALKFDALQQRVKTALEGGVSEAEVKKLFSLPDTIDSFRRQIEGDMKPVNLDVRVLLPVASADFAAKLIGDLPLKQKLDEEKRLTAEYEKQSGTVRTLQEELMKVTQAETSRKAAAGALGVNLQVQEAALEDWRTFLVQASAKAKAAILGGADIQAETKALGDLMRQFQSLSEAEAKGFGMKEYVALQKRAMDVVAQTSTTDFDRKFITEEMARLKTILDASEVLKKLQQTPQGQSRDIQAELEKARQEAERTKGIMDALKSKTPGETTKEMKTSAEGADAALNEVSQINMGGLVSQAQLLADAMWSVAEASLNVQPGPAMAAAHGGMAWKFLAGGGPAGTDVIPAMLSPGEVVINAASARRFASQLTAINAGVQPVYRSEGGSVTNVGDINVTVNGGGTSRQTARSIAAELRRELRRGTAIL
jgi:TP901 family phage tail tape measure protein